MFCIPDGDFGDVCGGSVLSGTAIQAQVYTHLVAYIVHLPA